MFENYRVFETEFAGRPLVVETGKTTQLANGACMVRYGETVVHVAVTAAPKPREGVDFFPLSVDYEEKQYALGKIPGGYGKRKLTIPGPCGAIRRELMEFLIITGLSGAGKSRAADVLEDLEYYCVDNMPVALMPRFAELCLDAHGRYDKVALVTDVRERDGFGELLGTLEELKAMDCTVRILYMDADLRTLVRRYKESRRPHPLAGPGITLEQAVAREEELLAPIKEKADYIINSSQLTLGQLQNRMFSIFAGTQKKRELQVTVMSFGYKHGIPLDADLVFDVRFLPNPFYVEALRPLSGLDLPVKEFVFGYPQTRKFMEMIAEMLDFLMPHYVEEGKVNLTIAIGCTGGRHRSVAIAAAIHEHLTAKGMSSINVNRDIEK